MSFERDTSLLLSKNSSREEGREGGEERQRVEEGRGARTYEDDDHGPTHDGVEDSEPVREERVLCVRIHPENNISSLSAYLNRVNCDVTRSHHVLGSAQQMPEVVTVLVEEEFVASR